MNNARSTRPQIIGQAQEAYDRLSPIHKSHVDAWLKARPHQVLYGRFEVLDAWLEWNGIIGYGEDFRRLFEAMK